MCINDLNGIQFKYLENEQSLNLKVPSNMLTGYSVDLSGQQITSPNLLKMKPLNAAILNYSLYQTMTNDENVFSGTAEGIFNSAIGNFSSGFYITVVMKLAIAMKNGYDWKVSGST